MRGCYGNLNVHGVGAAAVAVARVGGDDGRLRGRLDGRMRSRSEIRKRLFIVRESRIYRG